MGIRHGIARARAYTALHSDPAVRRQGAFVLAVLAGDVLFAAAVLLGFAGGLRQGDVTGLSRASLEFDDDEGGLYVVLSEEVSACQAPPKTARRGLARDQHVLVYEPLVVEFVRSVFGAASPTTGLCSLSVFNARWRRYLHGFFGLDVKEAIGYTPSWCGEYGSVKVMYVSLCA